MYVSKIVEGLGFESPTLMELLKRQENSTRMLVKKTIERQDSRSQSYDIQTVGS